MAEWSKADKELGMNRRAGRIDHNEDSSRSLDRWFYTFTSLAESS